MSANPQSRYNAGAIVLHWLIALLILTNIGLAWWFNTLHGDAKTDPVQLHKSIGITVLLLSALRLGWRLVVRPPPLPAYVRGWERWLAHSVQVLASTWSCRDAADRLGVLVRQPADQGLSDHPLRRDPLADAHAARQPAARPDEAGARVSSSPRHQLLGQAGLCPDRAARRRGAQAPVHQQRRRGGADDPLPAISAKRGDRPG